jgi:hypothetical protein
VDDRMARERVTLHRYRGEVVAEVVVDEGGGDLRTVSAALEVVDSEQRTLEPRGDLPESHAEQIRREVADSEFSLEHNRHPTA